MYNIDAGNRLTIKINGRLCRATHQFLVQNHTLCRTTLTSV